MTELFAVMGNPIAHSLSPQIHHYFAQQTGIDLIYEKRLIALEQFESSVRQFFFEGGKGLNVTLPFKERAFAMSQRQTSRAKLAKSANTLWMEEGLLVADNTDGIGFINDLRRHLTAIDSQCRCLIIGAGGAARGIIGPMLEAGVTLSLINRTKDKTKTLLADFPKLQVMDWETPGSAYDLIINASSATTIELPATLLKKDSFCYDLSYRAHEKTPFLQWADSHKARAVDGLGMLVEQAAEAFFDWQGIRPDTSNVLNVIQL